MYLINALHPKWQHALYAPLRVEICAGLEQVSVRDINNVKRIRAAI